MGNMKLNILLTRYFDVFLGPFRDLNFLIFKSTNIDECELFPVVNHGPNIYLILQ
jgi:hypothetical protein